MKGMEELTHHGNDGLHLGFPSVDQLLVEGPDIGIVLGGHSGWHEQSRSEVALPARLIARACGSRYPSHDGVDPDRHERPIGGPSCPAPIRLTLPECVTH